MEIFRYNKVLLKLAGLSTTPIDSKLYKYLPHFWLMSVSIIIIPSIMYVTENLADLSETTDVYYVVASNLESVVKFYLLWSHMNGIKTIMELLQSIVNESKCLRLQPLSAFLIVFHRNCTTFSTCLCQGQMDFGKFDKSLQHRIRNGMCYCGGRSFPLCSRRHNPRQSRGMDFALQNQVSCIK